MDEIAQCFINHRFVMLPVKTIFAAHDGSPGGKEALVTAAAWAEFFSAQLVVGHVDVMFSEQIALQSTSAGTSDPVAPILEDIDHLAKAYPNLQIEQVQRMDVAAAPALLEMSTTSGADLLVVGTHGRRGIQRMFLGSVAEEVARKASKPVLVARAGRSRLPKTILLPVDFSQFATDAIQPINALTASLGASLMLAHVIEQVLHPAFYQTGAMGIYDVLPDLTERSKEQLEQLYKQQGGAQESTEFRIRHGHAHVEISSVAEEEQIDLITMPTHGLRGLSHLLMGSVAERVVRFSQVPVLVWR